MPTCEASALPHCNKKQALGPTNFNQAWRHRHENSALDGAQLFIEHPLGIEGCRLSTQAAPLDAKDVFATVSLNDEAALNEALQSFYAAHGGQGQSVATFAPYAFRPYRWGQ